MNAHKHEWIGEWFDLWSCNTCGEYVSSANMPDDEMQETLERIKRQDEARQASWAKPKPQPVPENERIPTLWRKSQP